MAQYLSKYLLKQNKIKCEVEIKPLSRIYFRTTTKVINALNMVQ